MNEPYSRICDYLTAAVKGGGMASATVFVGSSESDREAMSRWLCDVLAPCGIISLAGATEEGALISVSDVRDVLSQISRTTFEGGRRVILCTNADRLTQEAGNALLKCTEEPPAQTLFIFAVQHEQALLPTIASRCQIIRLPTQRVALGGSDLWRYHQWRKMFSLPLWNRMAVTQATEGTAPHGDEIERYIHHMLNDNQSSKKDWANAVSCADHLRELYRYRSLASARSANDRLALAFL
ncbi:hypothetical protein HY623_01205 [Candidatus Uhrbacteria bacterium]|nr:hypothetical protein [Candidatus Uhrbacteria bacterium]